MSETEREFVYPEDESLYALDIVSSDAHIKVEPHDRREPKLAPPDLDETRSRAFRVLADPKLPELARAARARLLIQSPTRLYFYWSVGGDPFAALTKALGGGTSDYSLVLRLLDQTAQTEQLFSIEPEGSWWFAATAGSEYRAEVGFYSPSRPFVRILFSNTVETPRKGPSPHRASEARWTISAGKFAEVLDVSGFREDAMEVAATELAEAFAQRVDVDLTTTSQTELTDALAQFAAGTPIEDLKWQVSAEVYALLELARSEKVEFETFTAVGGSLVNFPRQRVRPVSSF
jgi:hypothetical protein